MINYVAQYNRSKINFRLCYVEEKISEFSGGGNLVQGCFLSQPASANKLVCGIYQNTSCQHDTNRFKLIIIKVFFAQLRFSFIQAIHFFFFAVSLLQKFEYHFFISMSFVNDQS